MNKIGIKKFKTIVNSSGAQHPSVRSWEIVTKYREVIRPYELLYSEVGMRMLTSLVHYY